ncbi:HDIG domain-containing protein [Cohnella pontilimi]|uniref:HDIG domain-containing protein n=1 Tax=Cohnella pontilimi TaxID=2564100 RepID=A0A4U0FIY8_9BACL|nr:HDIG domain-containing metalloprotein [Cohnella pontilimi]TJY43422.1 HDIG domain-containing protein [Cohnella pontilimi]
MSRNRSGTSGTHLTLPQAGWQHSVAIRWLLILLFALLFYFSIASRLVPETYNITLGAVSDRDIKAPHQIADQKSTLEAQEKAAAEVDPVYAIVPMRNEQLIDEIFTRIEQLNQDAEITEDKKVDIYRREIPERVERHVQTVTAAYSQSEMNTSGLLTELQKIVASQMYQIPEETFYKLPRLSADQLTDMKTVGKDIVRKLTYEALTDAETARTKVAEQVNASSLTLKIEREIVQELVRLTILPNKFFDKKATEAAKVEAKQNTPTVLIKQGDILVKKGQVVNEDIYSRLLALDLLQEHRTYWPQLGVFLLAVLMTIGLYVYGTVTAPVRPTPTRSNLHWLMLLIIFGVNILIMHLVALTHSPQLPFVGFLAPVAMGSMLVTMLLDLHFGLVSASVFTLLASIILNVEQESLFDFRYGFAAAVVSFTAVLAIHRVRQRSSILKAGIMVSLFGSLAVIALLLVGQETDQLRLAQAVGFMFGSGLLTAVLVIGLMPFFEVTFGLLSAVKLVELSNPNHPLLRKLLTETPGTYHHSLMVGNLSEAAAEAIGANGLLCRVGSFYHDVGKTKRPQYFIENQNGGDNPHDKLDPKVSTSIIIAHARDGAEMLKTHKLPKQIRDIAEQHHGTTFLKYFYYKAVKQAKEQDVIPTYTEDDFRYPGPKAQTKEAAIVGIADCVEAAVRSLNHPKVEQIEQIIGKIIKDRLDDNQFNECDLTLRELDQIAESLKQTVIGMFHSRIEYPDDKDIKPLKKPTETSPAAADQAAAGLAKENLS